eukprot:gnl/Chilomastix_caulleri/1113.p1 GENE.gnl/Chilomastix_caulleri/1113~~gnl/Chilomastix_caulleri/1113.p1  ORF type:complete len:98 (+),score=17.04 gnl/Chilomastix_caulleri/1113:78-371(+)
METGDKTPTTPETKPHLEPREDSITPVPVEVNSSGEKKHIHPIHLIEQEFLEKIEHDIPEQILFDPRSPCCSRTPFLGPTPVKELSENNFEESDEEK